MGEVARAVNGAIQEVISVAEPILKPILGSDLSGELFFAKFLFLLIVFSVVWVALSKVEFFNEKTWVLVLISVAASILGVRWLATEAIVNTILLPYSVLGMAVSAGLPFVLMFLVVNKGFEGPEHVFPRKAAWILFAVIFAGLWVTRIDQLGGINEVITWVYPAVALLGVGMAWNDGIISGWLSKGKTERATAHSRNTLIRSLRRELNQNDADLAAETITEATHRKNATRIHNKISALSR